MTRHIQSDALKLLSWLGCTIALGAALAPLIFYAGKWMADLPILDGYISAVLKRSDFDRYFNRAILLAALICIIPLLRSLKLGRKSFTLLSTKANPAWKSHFLGGFFLAGGFLLILGCAYLALGLFESDKGFDLRMAGKFMVTALVVSLLEEWIFRGMLLDAVLRSSRQSIALLFVTFFFALVHFLKPPGTIDLNDADVKLTTGFWIIGQIFIHFGNPVFIAAEFATLFAVGWVLGWARLRTCSLWLSIGLHSGWVFSYELYRYHTFMPRQYSPELFLPYIGTNLKSGLIPLTTVCLTGVVSAIWLYFRHRRP
ncbi:MAG: CPBP family intramembrane metalloprotease [Verrucomicrobiaceae bacterium]|nr:CPBP family intramembrane metalloprotease [Verrucomicrobiaceae bacterium]